MKRAASATRMWVSSPWAGIRLATWNRSSRRSSSIGGFIRSPQVSVLVSDYRSQKVAVMGQVGRPGQYPLRKASSVMDLLAEAGGVVNAMAADEATLLRSDGSKRTIDLFALFQGDPQQNPHGDRAATRSTCRGRRSSMSTEKCSGPAPIVSSGT